MSNPLCPRCGVEIDEQNQTNSDLCADCLIELRTGAYKLYPKCKSYAEYAKIWLSDHSKPVYHLIQDEDLLTQFGEQIYAQTDDWMTPDGTYVCEATD